MKNSFKSYLWSFSADLTWTHTYPHCPEQEKEIFLLSVAGKDDTSLLSRSIKMLWKQMCPVLTSPENKKRASHCPAKMEAAGSTFFTWWISPLCAYQSYNRLNRNSKKHVKCLSGSLHTFTDPDWNSPEFFFSCKVSFGINHVFCFSRSCIKQFTTPGDFQPPAGCCHPRPASGVVPMIIPQPASMNMNHAAL